MAFVLTPLLLLFFTPFILYSFYSLLLLFFTPYSLYGVCRTAVKAVCAYLALWQSYGLDDCLKLSELQ